MATWVVSSDDRDAEGAIKLADDGVGDAPPAVEAASTVAPAPRSDRLAAFLPAQERAGSSTAAQARAPLSQRSIALMVMGALFLVVAFVLLASRGVSDTPARALAAPTAAPTLAPTTTPFGAPLDAAVVAYFDYQRLDTATALDRDMRVLPVARVDHEWLQLQLQDSTRIWVRWRDLPSPSVELLGALPDLAPPTPTPAPTEAPPPTPAPVYVPPQPTIDTRPISCVTTEAGQLCRRGLDEHDSAVATEIAATSQAYNAPYQAAYDATATAVARR